MPDCLVSFGSNLGDRETTIRHALNDLGGLAAAKNIVVSALRETSPIGGKEGQGAFLNGAVRFQSELSADALHSVLRQVERQAGRERHERWSARTLDLDLIGYGSEVILQDELRVPHPRMSFRPFVLEPACEVAPNWRHPELGVCLADLLKVLVAGSNVVQVIGAVGPLVEAELAIRGLNVPVEIRNIPLSSLELSQRAKLLIDGSFGGAFGGSSGSPRLRLADCPAESWRTEVRAALESVWPMCDNVI